MLSCARVSSTGAPSIAAAIWEDGEHPECVAAAGNGQVKTMGKADVEQCRSFKSSKFVFLYIVIKAVW